MDGKKQTGPKPSGNVALHTHITPLQMEYLDSIADAKKITRAEVVRRMIDLDMGVCDEGN